MVGGMKRQFLRVLVTGGAGFIGSAICRHFILDGENEVLNLDKLTYAANLTSLEQIANNPRYQFVQMDICNCVEVTRILQEFKPDVIIHLAAETHVDRSIDSAAPFIETNVVGTYVLLDAARTYWLSRPELSRDNFRFVFVSTDEVYGSIQVSDPAFREESAYNPSSPYAASKAAADHLAMAWYRTYGLPIIISNCCNNFGPYQFPEKLIPLTILNALGGLPIRVYGNGENIRDWLFVEDHARALDLIVQGGQVGRKYNVGARNERTNLEVVKLICDIVDEFRPSPESRRQLITFVSDRPGHDFRYAIDPTRLERELQWSAQDSFEVNLRSTVAWYVNNAKWWRPLREQVYAGQRLGGPAKAYRGNDEIAER